MVEGPRGGPRPFADSELVIKVGFETFEVPEDEIQKLDTDQGFISELIDFMQKRDGFNKSIQPNNIESSGAGLSINIPNASLIRLYNATMVEDFEAEMNNITALRHFMEDQVGTVNEIAFRIE
jgi:hypothetical protein